MSITTYALAELEARAAELRRLALKEDELAFPMEGNASRARRNRRKNHYLELAVEYKRLARIYGGVAGLKAGDHFTYLIPEGDAA